MQQTINEVFRAYDIRGDYPLQINEEFAYRIGKAIAVFLKSKKIIVGRDCRNSSKELSQALVRGITEQGVEAVDIGLCSTPMINFASQKEDAIIVTASHLPAQKNGFKIFKKGTTPIGENNGLLHIKELYEKNKFESKKCGEIQQSDIMRDYVHHVLKFAKNITELLPKSCVKIKSSVSLPFAMKTKYATQKSNIKKLNIVIDAGNGMAGYTTPYIFANLACNVSRLFFELNGNFPNRSPNPFEKDALKTLCETVVKQNADLGAAYDADCDRIVFADEKGQVVPSDITLALLIQELMRAKKDTVVYEPTLGKIVLETVQQLKCTPVLSKVGHTFIHQTMQAKKAILGGERSGHYFFKDNNYADSGDIALMLILSLLSKTNQKMSELVAPLKKYYGLQEAFSVADKEKVMKEVELKFKNEKLTRFDGITVEFSDWWFNLRPSNTEAIVRLTIEAKSKKIAEQKMREVGAMIANVK